MKESNTNKNIENDKIVDFDIEKKFEEDLNEIKQKLNAERLSDEFKEKLQAKLEAELNDNNSTNKNKVIKFPVITRKLAGICACFVFLFTSCIAFADEIENIFFNCFASNDKIIERAIENGTYKEIDMDYVEDNGVSIKVDYIIAEEDSLYIAFNVLNNNKFDRIQIDDINIKNQNNEILYEKGNIGSKVSFNFEKQFVSSKNIDVLYKLTNFNYESQKLVIDVKNIWLRENGIYITKNGNWKINI